MEIPDEIRKWIKYQERTAGGKPRALLIKAVDQVSERVAALDLGAGALNESEYLVHQGFKEIVAVDLTPQHRYFVIPPETQFKYVESTFDKYDFPKDYFNLISAQYSLPFTKKELFPGVWNAAREALKSGGIFTGQLFGLHDDWSADQNMTFHSKEEIQQLLEGFEILTLKEQEFTETETRGKHWHYFDIIARKN